MNSVFLFKNRFFFHFGCCLLPEISSDCPKKYCSALLRGLQPPQSSVARLDRIGGRGGLAPYHLGGNNEQNYCVQLSSIKQLMYRNYPENLGGLGKLGGPVSPPGPNIEPPLLDRTPMKADELEKPE